MNARVCTLLICLGLAVPALPQTAATPAPPAQDSRATAYYNFAMAHIYAELAQLYGFRSEYVDKAIEHYKAAMKADPNAGFLSEELTDLYIQAGKLRDAVTEAEDMLKRNPENLEARRILGRIYTRMIGDQQQNKINETMLRNAIEQYQKIVAKDASDTESWVMLGRLQKIAQDSVEAEKAFKKALELDPNNESALTGLALVYTDLGDTRRALEMWRRVSEQSPSPRSLRALAQAYEQAHDYRGAAETLRRAVDAEPRNLDLKKSLADDLLLGDDVDGALKLYNDIARADPKDARVHVRLSQVYRQKRDFVKAHEEQKLAEQLEPDSLEVRYNAVNLLNTEGRYSEAINALKQIIDTTGGPGTGPSERANRVMLFERLGLLYRANEQYAEAVQAFEQMPQADADSGSRSAALIVETWQRAKEFGKAEQVADAAIRKFPDNRLVKAARASLLADIGKVDEAITALKSLLGGKDDRETYLELAGVYDKGKRYTDMAQALAAAEKLSESNEDKVNVYFMRGAMYEKTKEFQNSETEFRKVLDLDPDNAAAMNYLGYMMADRSIRLEEARKLIARALELEPNNGAYLDSLGWVYFRLGKLDEAERNLRAAIERTGRDPVVHDHLADVYLQQGKLKDAIAQWERSLAEWQVASKSEYDPAEVTKVTKKLETTRVRLAKEGSPAGARR